MKKKYIYLTNMNYSILPSYNIQFHISSNKLIFISNKKFHEIFYNKNYFIFQIILFILCT